MEWWQTALLVLLVTLGVLALAAFWFWRKASGRTRALAARVQRLSGGAKFQLAIDLARDERIPMSVRIIPPLLVLYLSLPLDLVPDFIPVIGQLDDVVVVMVGAGMLMKFTPVSVIEDHLAALEAMHGNSTTSRLLPPGIR